MKLIKAKGKDGRDNWRSLLIDTMAYRRKISKPNNIVWHQHSNIVILLMVENIVDANLSGITSTKNSNLWVGKTLKVWVRK